MVFFFKFAAYFRNTFFEEDLWTAASGLNITVIMNYVYIKMPRKIDMFIHGYLQNLDMDENFKVYTCGPISII